MRSGLAITASAIWRALARYPGLPVAPIKLGQAAENDTLVVGPGGAVVVRAASALRRQPVVDQVLVIDHSTATEPIPRLTESVNLLEAPLSGIY